MLPKSLFKFESINEYSLRNLKNAKIYFNAPANYNDPFDCSASIIPRILTEKEIIEISKYFIDDINEKFSNKIKSINSIIDIPKSWIEHLPIAIETYLKEHLNTLNKEIGCSCFSATKENILLWSHYANNHKGICLEFDTSFKPFNKALEVIYSDNISAINPLEIMNAHYLIKTIFTKYSCWQYEKEWRIFHNAANTLLGYEPEALKSVYFGCEMNEADMAIVSLIIQGQSDKTKFYRAHKNTSSYSLYFE